MAQANIERHETQQIQKAVECHNPPWDPQGVPLLTSLDRAAQIHQQSYIGRGPAPTHSRQNSFDMYDLYAKVKPFNNPYTPAPGAFRAGPNSVFETNALGQPKFVDDL